MRSFVEEDSVHGKVARVGKPARIRGYLSQECGDIFASITSSDVADSLYVCISVESGNGGGILVIWIWIRAWATTRVHNDNER